MRTGILVFWILFGLYFGIGGWTKIDFEQKKEFTSDNTSSDEQPFIYDGFSFDSYGDVIAYVEKEKIYKYVRWIFYLPSFIGFVITAGAFGVLGGVTNIIKEIVTKKKEDDDIEVFKVFYVPLLGFLIGLLMLGIVQILPSAITFNQTDVNPASLLFLCMFAGIFYENFFTWFGNIVKTIFR
jgi:hypothetical protein